MTHGEVGPDSNQTVIDWTGGGIQIIHDITQALGKEVWSKTIVGLTHANLNNLPPGYDYGEFPASLTGSPVSLLPEISSAGPRPRAVGVQ